MHRLLYLPYINYSKQSCKNASFISTSQCANSSQEATKTEISTTHDFQEDDANIDATLLQCIAFGIPSILKQKDLQRAFHYPCFALKQNYLSIDDIF